MKAKTEISKLTLAMNLGQISIGNYLRRLVELAKKYGSAFSPVFLKAVEEEAERLKDHKILTKQQAINLDRAFGSVLNSNPPRTEKKDD